MNVVGHSLVMRRVALSAVGRGLALVKELRRLGMTDRAGDLRVRHPAVLTPVNDREKLSGHALRCGFALGVAVKTKTGDLLGAGGVFHIHGQMTAHACLVFLGKSREGGPLLVATTALFVTRLVRGKPPNAVFSEPWLDMRFVTPNAALVLFRVVHGLSPVDPLRQLILHFLMTHQAKVCLKKGLPFLVHIQRVWVNGLLPDIFVAVQTRRLAVGGDVKPPGIHQPGSVRFPRKSQKKTTEREGCKRSFHESSLDAHGLKKYLN
jgi:hypothetical protein